MSLARADVLVAGGGVSGLCVALVLARRGLRTVLRDPGAPSASAVAAGMVAPALEALFDPLAEGRFPLLRAAVDRWPALLAEAGLDAGLLRRSGALIAAQAGEEAGLERLAARLGGAGVPARPLSGTAARGLQPALSPGIVLGLLVDDEWRLSPAVLLEALAGAFRAAGGEIVSGPPLSAREASPAALGAGRLVIAAGAGGRGLAPAAPELARLEPVRGQILAFAAASGPTDGPTLRTVSGAYVAPQTEGALAGGTMEPGREDLDPDDAVAQRLRGQAAALLPSLASAAAVSRVGVRASAPDGLPLAGASRAPGVSLAVGMRRNGWLLAPLAAEIVAAEIMGAPPPVEAALFAPGRFDG